MVTPAHIVPEWYFLPLYAVLRAVTNKLLGIFLIVCFIACIFMIPFFCKKFFIRSTMFRPIYRFFVWSFFMNVLLLFWIGSLPVIDPYILIGQLLAFFYFFHIVVCFPLIRKIESYMYIAYIREVE
jgi:ubiquinol-cytochrome c reductase cytochrome b subunit